MAEAILNAPHFQDADKAREYLEAQVWPHGRVCPHCGVIGDHYALHGVSNRPGLYKCFACREPFTVTVGTVFERSKIGLHLWLQTVYLMSASKKGISAKQLERMLGVTYKTAWFMAHRIREAMKTTPDGLLGSGGGTVEADETYWGNNKRSKIGRLYADLRGGAAKEKIFSLVQREGKVRTFHVQMVNAKTLKEVMDKHIAKEANLMTDEARVYMAIGKRYASHGTTNHSAGQYVNGNMHSNTVEGYFSIFKRGLIGTFHHVGEQHLQRYCNEFDFRYNSRTALGFNDIDRTNLALKGITGKRLTYRRTDRQVQALQV